MEFGNFIVEVEPQYQGFVGSLHEYLLQNGCLLKMTSAKNGYVVSYQHGKKKRVIMNFVFRKSGLFTRIYCDHIGKYIEALEGISANMVKTIEKAPLCKRFDDPSQCNSKCSGYVFTLKGKQHQKCRYNCFLFAVSGESIPFIRTLFENELQYRTLAEAR